MIEASTNWDPEDDLDVENINPEIPKDLWDSLVWKATRQAINLSDTTQDVLRRVKLWNIKNNPQLPEKELVQKVIWALQKWDSKFRSV